MICRVFPVNFNFKWSGSLLHRFCYCSNFESVSYCRKNKWLMFFFPKGVPWEALKDCRCFSAYFLECPEINLSDCGFHIFSENLNRMMFGVKVKLLPFPINECSSESSLSDRFTPRRFEAKILRKCKNIIISAADDIINEIHKPGSYFGQLWLLLGHQHITLLNNSANYSYLILVHQKYSKNTERIYSKK